jgi:hypothetical protein
MSGDIKVDIFAEPDSNSSSGYSFSMTKGGKGASTLVFDKNEHGMKKSEHFKIAFKLHNTKGANLRFSKLADQVMWAMATEGPTGQCPPPQSAFPGFYVDPATYIQDDLLTVVNEDMDVQAFSYCLNFVPVGTVEGPDTVYVPYDPIGENRNGGVTRGFTTYLASPAVAVAAVVAIAAVIGIAFVARS